MRYRLKDMEYSPWIVRIKKNAMSPDILDSKFELCNECIVELRRILTFERAVGGGNWGK